MSQLEYWKGSPIATIMAIVLTIMFTVENQKSERKLLIRPCLQTTYIPQFIRIDKVIKEGLIVYISYNINGDENIKSLLQPPYILKKAEEDKNKAALNFESFYRQYHIIHYTVSNVGAGNALNIKFLIDGKPTIPPFSLVANNSKEFIIILSSKLLNNHNRIIQFNFEYEDVASLGKYEQHERINFFREDDELINTSQAIENLLSMPKDS